MNQVVSHQPQGGSLAPESSGGLTVKELHDRIQRIQQAMRAVMKDGTHFGTIPGTQKPTLLKPGSEVLLSMFQIAVDPDVEDLSAPDEVRYRVRCRAVHAPTGQLLGAGVGECSSNEDKYKWRAAVNEAEWEATDPDRRREKHWHNRGQNTDGVTRQVRTNPSDVSNTVLKMAKKRAQIDMTLTVLGCSDIFEQDLDEMDESTRQGGSQHTRPRAEPPQAKANARGFATESQQKLIRVKCDQAGVAIADFCDHFEVESVTQLPFARVNEGLAWIQQMKAAGGEQQ